MRKDEPIRIDTGRRHDGDIELTVQEQSEILYLAREAKNRRISAVLIHPDYKRASSLFVRGCDYVSVKPGRV